jgi:hypothetical protein
LIGVSGESNEQIVAWHMAARLKMRKFDLGELVWLALSRVIFAMVAALRFSAPLAAELPPAAMPLSNMTISSEPAPDTKKLADRSGIYVGVHNAA